MTSRCRAHADRRLSMVALAAAACGLMATGRTYAADAPADPAAVSRPFAIRQTLDDARQTTRLTLDPSFVIAALDRNEVAVELPISASAQLTLDLRSVNLIAADASFVLMRHGRPEPMAAPTISVLRGEVRGEPGSRAVLTLTGRGGGGGSITRGDGSILLLGTDRDPIDGRPRGLIVQHGPGDAPPFNEFCRAIDMRLNDANGAPGPAGGPSPAQGPRTLRVAIDSDLSYRQLFSTDDDALAYMAQVVAAVDDIYRRDLNLTLQLVFTRLWPLGGEPFGADNIGGFRQHWVDNENTAGIDLVHLFSGRRDLSYGGIAYLAGACSGFGYGITGFMLGSLPTLPGLPPNLGNWDAIVVAHEMGHNLGSPHTHDYDPPVDTCTSGSFERGTIMSYCHTRPGGLLNIDVRMHGRTQDIIAQENQSATCLGFDCNNNGVSDEFDILIGASTDLNADLIPDECQDCDGNGTLDPHDIALGAPDFDQNGVLDACEDDCNGNSRPDRWETAQGLVPDTNGNRVPDSCEPDCNSNGIADHTEILNGAQSDVDRNSVPDSCDDCDRNGSPDWLDIERQHNIFITQQDGVIREYHRASGVPIRTVAEGVLSSAADAAFGPDRQLYVADQVGGRIVRIDVDANTTTEIATINSPSGVAFGPNGTLLVVSQGLQRIVEIDPATGSTLRQFELVSGITQGVELRRVTMGPDGGVYVSISDQRVVRFDFATGQLTSTHISGVDGGLDDPYGMVILPDSSMIVANRGGFRLTRHAANGMLLGAFNDEYPLNQPQAVSVGPNGNIYAAALQQPVRVIEYDSGVGRYIRSFVRGDSELDTAPTAILFRPASSADANGNHVPDVCEQPICPGDVDGSGDVEVNDLLAVINAWGASGIHPADVTGDLVVNVMDLLAVINAWGRCR